MLRLSGLRDWCARPTAALGVSIGIALALGLCTPAGAAVGDLTFEGCVASTGAGGCVDAPGTPLSGAAGVAISPDGDSVYVVSLTSDTITHLSATPSGQLTFSECFSDTGSGGTCTAINGPAPVLTDPIAVAVSPDGATVWVGARGADAVSSFRVAANGKLAFSACVSDTGSSGLCTDLPGLPISRPGSIAVSPDGSSVYVGANLRSSVTHFFAAAGGNLGFDACASDDGSGPCTNVPGAPLAVTADVVVSPDGASVYAVGVSSTAISRFAAAPQGQITFAGCVSQSGSAGTCTSVPVPLDSASDLAVSPDGGSLYASAYLSHDVAHFRTAAGGITFADCLSDDGSGGACGAIPGGLALDHSLGLAASSDGASVYVAAEGPSAVTSLLADAQGGLGFGGCASDNGDGGCADLPGSPLRRVNAVAVSADGRSVYASAPNSDSISHFVREPLDADPPGLTLAARKVQAGKPVKVKVSCDEACSVSVSGTAKPRGGKKGQLGSASAQLAAGQTVQVVLRTKGRLKRKLRRAGKGKAQLAATATDPAGNSAAAAEKVKLK